MSRASPLTLIALGALGAVAALGWAGFAIAGHQSSELTPLFIALLPRGRGSLTRSAFSAALDDEEKREQLRSG
jgi:hypothetical protein